MGVPGKELILGIIELVSDLHSVSNNKCLLPACQLVPPSMNGFISGVESSGWLKHVRSVLDTAVFITAAMMEGVSVLVHCSDGWDRTAQTCALAQLLLDPYYRTIQGFQVVLS